MPAVSELGREGNVRCWGGVRGKGIFAHQVELSAFGPLRTLGFSRPARLDVALLATEQEVADA